MRSFLVDLFRIEELFFVHRLWLSGEIEFLEETAPISCMAGSGTLFHFK
jgi:hypothetical protein